jgi:hypothetical protein
MIAKNNQKKRANGVNVNGPLNALFLNSNFVFGKEEHGSLNSYSPPIPLWPFSLSRCHLSHPPDQIFVNVEETTSNWIRMQLSKCNFE